MSTRAIRPHRVVITGLGTISALGRAPHELWENASRGQLGIGPIRRFDTTNYNAKHASEIPDDDWLAAVPPEVARKECRTTSMALYAARQALTTAGIVVGEGPLPIGVYLGSGAGPSFASAQSWEAWVTKGLRGVRPTTVVHSMFNVAASTISLQLRLTGGHQVFAAACASATTAIGHAYCAIVSGLEQCVLAGGCESPLEPGVFAAWHAMRVLAAEADPAKCCRPFDKQRSGFVLAEGAHFLVLEELAAAQRRGAPILAEVLGYGQSSDATHITLPSTEGQVAAMRHALDSAGLSPDEVDYVNAHGTGTQANDRVETASLKTVFAGRLPHVSSTKSMHGHALGATGALETILCALSTQHDTIPPTIGFETPDPECDLDVTPNHAVSARVDVAMNNSFAFGGMNSVLILGKPKEREPA